MSEAVGIEIEVVTGEQICKVRHLARPRHQRLILPNGMGPDNAGDKPWHSCMMGLSAMVMNIASICVLAGFVAFGAGLLAAVEGFRAGLLAAGAGFVASGASFVVLGLVDQYVWFGRLRGHRLQGVIVDYEAYHLSEGSLCYRPRVEYCHEGASHQFVSSYGEGKLPRIGSTVEVVVAPGCTEAEVLSSWNRFGSTIVLFATGLCCLWFGRLLWCGYWKGYSLH